MAITTYARGIPTYKGENGQTIGLLCETKEQCITDDDGVRLSDKLASMQEQVGEGPDLTGYATKEYVDNSVSGLASAESVANIVSGATTVGKASAAETATRATTADSATKATTADSATKATSDGNGNNIADTYFTKSGVVVLDTDPGIGVSVSYPNGTLLFVKGA